MTVMLSEGRNATEVETPAVAPEKPQASKETAVSPIPITDKNSSRREHPKIARVKPWDPRNPNPRAPEGRSIRPISATPAKLGSYTKLPRFYYLHINPILCIT